MQFLYVLKWYFRFLIWLSSCKDSLYEIKNDSLFHGSYISQRKQTHVFILRLIYKSSKDFADLLLKHFLIFRNKKPAMRITYGYFSKYVISLTEI